MKGLSACTLALRLYFFCKIHHYVNRATNRTTSGAYPLPCHGERCIEPLLEGAAALEDGGQQEVEQGPELGQLVLQRRSCQEEASGGHVVGVQHLGQLTVVVLHAVTLVHNHVLPTNLQKEKQKC